LQELATRDSTHDHTLIYSEFTLIHAACRRISPSGVL
jgi:hypothetical protein